MKIWEFWIISVCLLVLMTGYQRADAQEALAQEVSAIFQQSCLICHGPHGSFTENLVIENSQALIETGKVIPGNPDGSIFYQRLIETAVERRMPRGQPPLSDVAIQTIKEWILAGAPDWNAFQRTDINFITTEEMLQTIENHVESLEPFDRAFARYFTSTHLYNAGETMETLRAYQRALSKLVNSLSWGREVTKPQPIDPQATIFYIDLRDYEWEIGTNRWTLIETEYPYKIAFDAPTQTHLREKLANLRQEMNCDVPFVHVDWFLATASLPPLYHDILDLPLTDRALETRLEVNVVENIRNAPGRRVWRAGFNDSGVSNHNRVVERHLSRYGAYWKSYDFAGSVGTQNIFTHPLDFTHDGGEIIFNLPNDLQAYYLADAGGNRLDEAPISIVSNPAVSDPTVRNGLSCIGCHTEGMKTFEDQVRGVVEQNENPPFDKDRALRLYVEKTVMDGLIEEDTDRYRQALEATGDVFGGIEPVQRFHEAFQAPLDASRAAAAVGLETEIFLGRIRENTSLQNLGLLVLESGTVKRDTWTTNFEQVISALNTPDSDLPPVVQRPERIPGAGVYIPDPNLRSAIAEALGKAAGDVIAVEDMETLTHLDAENKGISDLTGLEFATHMQRLDLGFEFATNLERLDLNGNQISDISPLTGLINLERLDLNGNQISDISPLAGLINLRVLEIRQNQISDISPLAGLINLLSLNIRRNPLSDISPLASAIKLEFVEVSDTLVSDISPLAGLKNLHKFSSWNSPISDISALIHLTIIDMCGAPISDISSLAEAKNLRELYLLKCNISDVSPLTELAGLTRLNLEGNNISDVSPLAALTQLEWLKLTNNPITDFSPLEALSQNTTILTHDVAIPDSNLRAAIAEALGKDDTTFVSITVEEMATLTELRAQAMEIRDITGLEFAINLENLFAPDNQIADLSPLSELINLRILNVYHNPIENLTPIAGLSNLEYITLIGDGGISDISPLAGFVKLKHFLTWGNPISDLSPLAGLTQLETLDICGSEASDISPLAKLTGLKELYLVENGILDVSPLRNLTALTRLSVAGNKISDASPLAPLNNLKWLALQRNSISDFSSLDALPETTKILWHENPGFPSGGPKIEGPWLWLLLPGTLLDNSTDLLAQASDGVVTEMKVATNGTTEGEPVGDSIWTSHKLMPTRGNIWELLNANAFGIETAGNIKDNYVVYGSVALYSPREQNTKMYVGSYRFHKVWLNGTLVDNKLNEVWARDYQDFFPVTLKQGINILLVAISSTEAWDMGGFFGFEKNAEYILSNAGIGYTFSQAAIHVGETFTLDISAADIFDLAGWQFDIAFDPAVLEAIEVNEGDFLKEGDGTTFFQRGTIDNTTGKITKLSSARLNEDGATGTGTLLSVTFTAKAGGDAQITLENFQLGSIAGDSIPAAPHEFAFTIEGQLATGDVNRDGQVSVLDLILVSQHLGEDAAANPQADVNSDGVINIQDLLLVAQHIGESTAAAAPSVIAAINSGELTPPMIQAWIEQAEAADDGSLTFRQGISTLQHLLALLIPEETALLANYPNPFNPETWIPYQLAAPADVRLTIYALNGQVVRTLALGHQAAGVYQSKSRAAYWDGRNDVGEPVASGLYFYTLTAGDFTATRKMLIRK